MHILYILASIIFCARMSSRTWTSLSRPAHFSTADLRNKAEGQKKKQKGGTRVLMYRVKLLGVRERERQHRIPGERSCSAPAAEGNTSSRFCSVKPTVSKRKALVIFVGSYCCFCCPSRHTVSHLQGTHSTDLELHAEKLSG